MPCACRSGKTDKVKPVSGAKINEVHNMAKMVNFEGKMVNQNTIPQGSIYIKGVWYSSLDAVPDAVRREYKWLSQSNEKNKRKAGK